MKKILQALVGMSVIGLGVLFVYQMVSSHEMSWVEFGVHSITSITIFVLIAVLLRFMGSKGIIIYTIREGYFSIIVKGGENGAFDHMIGALKGHRLDPISTSIDVDNTAKPMGFMGFGWIGIWPFYSAMIFDGLEQVKQINKNNATIGLELKTYPPTIYIPIQTTERLRIDEMEIGNLAAKVYMELVITYRVSNGYIAKIRNRGSAKILKANIQQGMRELVADYTDYQHTLQLKNATDGKAALLTLVKKLNSPRHGYGTLSSSTGFELISIDVIDIGLAGQNADRMNEAYAKRVTATKEAEATGIKAEQDAKNIRLIGTATAEAELQMVETIARRAEIQAGMSADAALALAIEKSRVQVLSLGKGGVNPVVNIGNRNLGDSEEIPLPKPPTSNKKKKS